MEGLPVLPGYNFKDPTETKFHLSQQFDYKNGYALPRRVTVGVGRNPLDVDSVAFHDVQDTVRYDPSLTYGRVKNHGPSEFRPHFVLYDKKTLMFRAFFKQSVFESPTEHFRVRHVNILYFLEDDTITVMEPEVENSGLVQGRLVRRGKIPKTSLEDYWHWKDLNVGIDVSFYGIVLHIVDCDNFTKEFMESQGMELNQPEDLPVDPYTTGRELKMRQPTYKTQLVDDKLRRFLEFDGKVLRFYVVWDDRESDDCAELTPYVLYYYLSDDTMEVQEVHSKNSGKDPFPLLLRKMKLPKNWKDLPVNFPSLYLEVSDGEVTEYYTPKDLLVGETIFILGRRFLIYDCDSFTRKYFKTVLNIEQGKPIQVFPPKRTHPKPPIPPHLGFGSPEDSLQSCLSLQPKSPKKDVVRYVYNASKYLRYEARLDWVHPEDKDRKFIILYSLSNCHLSIMEPPIRNSGIIGGRFLSPTLVPKPGTDPSNPEYYTPADIYIGAVLVVFHHRFIITGADLFVHRYAEANPEKFPPEVVDNIRNYMFCKGLLKDDIELRSKQQAEEHREEERDQMCTEN